MFYGKYKHVNYSVKFLFCFIMSTLCGHDCSYFVSSGCHLVLVLACTVKTSVCVRVSICLCVFVIAIIFALHTGFRSKCLMNKTIRMFLRSKLQICLKMLVSRVIAVFAHLQYCSEVT